MMKVIYLIVCISVAFLNLSSSLLKFRNFQERIVGGVPASEGEFPYQVSILRFLNETHLYHTCGGSIIDHYWVLTAAHCVVGDDPSQFLILAGTHILVGSTYDVYNLSKVIWHEDYNKSFIYSNDIALLKTSEKIIYRKKSVESIALAQSNYRPGTELQVSGWGLLGVNNSSSVLQWVTVYLENTFTCKKKYESEGIFVHAQKQLCTYIEIGKGVCNGDSGGPLVYKRKVQLGIVSWGVPCALGFPDVYTNVGSYNFWIFLKMFTN